MLPVFESCIEGAIDAFEMFDFNVNTLLKIVPETVRPVRVPTLVIFACALPVTAPVVTAELATTPVIAEAGIFVKFTPEPVNVPAVTLPVTVKKPIVCTFKVVAFIVVAKTFVVWRAFDE